MSINGYILAFGYKHIFYSTKRTLLLWGTFIIVGILGGILSRFDVASAQQPASFWTNVSDGVLSEFRARGIGDANGRPLIHIATGGLSVDPKSGDLRMVVPRMGIWLSTNLGKSFTRWDDGTISGQCETGYSLNADPAGNRLACFMLDGTSGMTLDNGKTWIKFTQHGRGWDFGAVDWSKESPTTLFALAHESGGELYRSSDAGQTWQLVGKGFVAIGMFDAQTIMASKGDGLLRSSDGGETWRKVSSVTPSSRVMTLRGASAYWLTANGLLRSDSNGYIWYKQGAPMKMGYGPFFGKDDKQIVVIGQQNGNEGVWRSSNGGSTWTPVAPLPLMLGLPDYTPGKYWGAGWYYNFGWDWKYGYVYASRINYPTLKAKVN